MEQAPTAEKHGIGPDIRALLPDFYTEENAVLLHTGVFPGASSKKYDFLFGSGSLDDINISGAGDFLLLDAFLERNKGRWIFAHLSYELKDLFEKKLHSRHRDAAGFAMAGFFVPRQVCFRQNGQTTYLNQENGERSERTFARPKSQVPPAPPEKPALRFHDTELFKADYFKAFDTIQQHLRHGDIYEINYCLPFGAQGELPDPAALWWSMQQESQAPFSALYRRKSSWLLCHSPERFLQKDGTLLRSQPIKGTIGRHPDPPQDERQKELLRCSEKEQAENVMIVDLVRNDLGRIAQTGTVTVPELFGIYTFRRVHQMISTVEARLRPGTPFSAILQAAFPMGSMTGAPKISAMEIIEDLEVFRRGLYSGSLGYISPEGDFDFNVVIRSILYNSAEKNLLFPAGSAITTLSDAEKEFDECLLKAESMQEALRNP
ncbi:MAG: anthranilate synthase component I family protein [Bacteroidia bacterium]|nr:anthranilate synthase component I family protein [Bacteroidia bacterium]